MTFSSIFSKIREPSFVMDRNPNIVVEVINPLNFLLLIFYVELNFLIQLNVAI